MKKQGFILIDLIFGIIFTGMISAALFSSLYSLMSVSQRIIEVTRADNRFLLFHTIIGQDINALCIPSQVIKSPSRIMPSSSSPSSLPSSTKKSDILPLFEALSTQGLLDHLSFIATRELSTTFFFPADSSPPLSSGMVRITYTLEKEEKTPAISYRLMRQESTDLSYQLKNKSASYELITGIKEMTCTYLWSEPPHEGVKNNLKEVTHYDATTGKSPEKAGSPVRAFPDRIDITLALWDQTYNSEHTIKYSFCPLSTPFYTPAQASTDSVTSPNTLSRTHQ